MKVFLFALVAALFLAAPVTAAPLLDGGGPATGCPSEWAVASGFANGEYPIGYPNSDGISFCLNGVWVTRVEFFSAMGAEPEFYYSAPASLVESTSIATAPAEFRFQPTETPGNQSLVAESEKNKDYSWMGWLFLAIFLIVILLGKVFLFRGKA